MRWREAALAWPPPWMKQQHLRGLMDDEWVAAQQTDDQTAGVPLSNDLTRALNFDQFEGMLKQTAMTQATGQSFPISHKG